MLLPLFSIKAKWPLTAHLKEPNSGKHLFKSVYTTFKVDEERKVKIWGGVGIFIASGTRDKTFDINTRPIQNSTTIIKHSKKCQGYSGCAGALVGFRCHLKRLFSFVKRPLCLKIDCHPATEINGVYRLVIVKYFDRSTKQHFCRSHVWLPRAVYFWRFNILKIFRWFGRVNDFWLKTIYYLNKNETW